MIGQSTAPQRACFACYAQHAEIVRREKAQVHDIAQEINEPVAMLALVLKRESLVSSSRTPCVLVLGRFRLFCVKRGGKKVSGALYHHLDLLSLAMPRPGRLVLRYGKLSKQETSLQLETSAAISSEIVHRVREAHSRLTLGFPDSHQLELTVPPDQLRSIRVTHEVSPGGGFVDLYFGLCRFYNAKPSSEFIQYLVEVVESGSKWLCMMDAPGVESDTDITFDFAPIFAALRHNIYFRGVSMSGVTRRSAMTLLSDAVKFNTTFTRLVLRHMGAIPHLYLLGEAMSANSANYIQELDLSHTTVNAKATAALAAALRCKEYGLRRLRMAHCGMNGKMLLMLIRDGLQRNHGVGLSIQELDLSYNTFDEASSQELQRWLGAMVEYSLLGELRLARCHLNLTAVLRPLHSFVRLQLLDISRNKLDHGASQLLCTVADLSSTLSSLFVAGCGLSADHAASIVQSMVSNERVRAVELDLADNGFKEATIEKLARTLVDHNKNIKTLDLSSNQLTEKAVLFICGALQHLAQPTIHRIALNNVSLDLSTSAGIRVANAIANTLHKVPSLQSLSVSSGWTGRTIRPLLQNLYNNTSLTELSIEGNKLGDEGAVAIANFLRRNHGVTKLQLDGNKISLTGWTAIAAGIRRNTTLQHMNFSWRDLKDAAGRCSTDDQKARLRSMLLDIHFTVRMNRVRHGGEGYERGSAVTRAEGEEDDLEHEEWSVESLPLISYPPCPVPDTLIQSEREVDLLASTDALPGVRDGDSAAPAALTPQQQAAAEEQRKRREEEEAERERLRQQQQRARDKHEREAQLLAQHGPAAVGGAYAGSSGGAKRSSASPHAPASSSLSSSSSAQSRRQEQPQRAPPAQAYQDQQYHQPMGNGYSNHQPVGNGYPSHQATDEHASGGERRSSSLYDYMPAAASSSSAASVYGDRSPFSMSVVSSSPPARARQSSFDVAEPFSSSAAAQSPPRERPAASDYPPAPWSSAASAAVALDEKETPGGPDASPERGGDAQPARATASATTATSSATAASTSSPAPPANGGGGGPPPPPPAPPAAPAAPPPPPAPMPAAVKAKPSALLGSIESFNKGKLKKAKTVDKSSLEYQQESKEAAPPAAQNPMMGQLMAAMAKRSSTALK